MVAVLPGRSAERVIVGAHHDTVPEAPGAYDDGGGVGVLIETARVLARAALAAAHDRLRVVRRRGGLGRAGETRRGRSAGLRRGAGAGARDVVAAFVVEMCGWKGGTPVLHPIAYVDPLQPGSYVVSPAWVVAAALRGARPGGRAVPRGRLRWSWLYQPGRAPSAWTSVRRRPGVPAGGRAGRVRLGLVVRAPSIRGTTSPDDTADKLDALGARTHGPRRGGGGRGARRGPARSGAGPAVVRRLRRRWCPPPWLYAIGAVSLLPRLVRAAMARGMPAGLAAQAALFGFVLWRHPVVAVWVFLLPNLFGGLGGWRWSVVALAPLFLLAARAVFAWGGGAAHGLWLAPWDLVAAAAALALLWLSAARAGRTPRGSRGRGRAGAPRPSRGRDRLPLRVRFPPRGGTNGRVPSRP